MITSLILLSFLVSGQTLHAQVDPYTPYTFEDADELVIPNGGEPSPFAKGSIPPYPTRATRGKLVDLHAHAFMSHGMGVFFSGRFDEPLVSRSWDDRFSNQINDESLENSGLGLIVVSLYAHPVFAPARKTSIRHQIDEAENFVRTHPNWVIAKNPYDARKAFEIGKRIMVLSLEGASEILENEEDYREFIDQKGIRIVTFAHIADDHLTGAAFLGGFRMIGNPRGLIPSWLSPRHDSHGITLNPNGLTETGKKIAQDLIHRKVWIDLAHAPDATASELIPMLRAARQPLLYTHTSLRKYLGAERGISEEQITQVRDSGGILGIVPGESMVGNTPVPSGCTGGIFALAAQFNEIADFLGANRVYIGSDFNGAMDHLPPNKPCDLGTSLDKKGFYNIGQTGEFWFALNEAGAKSKETAEHGIENFIATWEKVFSSSR